MIVNYDDIGVDLDAYLFTTFADLGVSRISYLLPYTLDTSL